jgi:hypothetical protein
MIYDWYTLFKFRFALDRLALDFGDLKSDPRVAGSVLRPQDELATDPRPRDLQNMKPHPTPGDNLLYRNPFASQVSRPFSGPPILGTHA